ncbi:hypothetical protein SRRS_00900 [Sporomusa rhizae]|uniref:DMT family transporter n=1 Tax=Sporomusa rhizae TaxID=357999 RepID=UPI00352BB78E
MKSPKLQLYKGHLYIVLSSFGFSLVPLLAKFSLDSGMNAETMLTYRFIIAGGFFTLYSICNKIKLYTTMTTSLKLLGIGFLYALECTCFFTAFKYISPSIGELLFQITPIMVALTAYFVFKEKITLNVIIALLLTALGCILLIWEPSAHRTSLGIVIILIAVLLYTAYIIIGKQMLKNIDSIVVTTYITVGCGLFLLLYSLLSDKLMPINNPKIVSAIIVLALFSTIISILSFAMGLKLLGATNAVIISTLDPVFTVVLAYLFMDEKLSPIQILGGLLIIMSIVIIETKGSILKSVFKLPEKDKASEGKKTPTGYR